METQDYTRSNRFIIIIEFLFLLILIIVVLLPLVFNVGVEKGKNMAGYTKADQLHEYYKDGDIYNYCPYCGEEIRGNDFD